MSQHEQRPSGISRRELLLLSLGLALSPGSMLASNRQVGSISWDTFLVQMKQLADAAAAGKIDPGFISRHGMQFLQQLNMGSAEFEAAVNVAYESGNRFWMWQRMVKEENINGGILNIDRGQLVQLHDHPGATGVLRIISGETEIWQFDEVASSAGADGKKTAELNRVSHRILTPGDTAVLTPDAGNIHALKAASKQSSMLDFFIPPYKRSQRSWYQPIDKDWYGKDTITCLSIPQHEFVLT